MAVDAFLWLEKSKTNAIEPKGETSDSDMSKKNAIEIQSYSLGGTNPINVGSATGGLTAGKADFSGLSVMHQVDTASADLMKALALGEHFPKATLRVRRSGGKNPNRYVEFEFQKVFVAGVSWSGGAGDEVLIQQTDFEWGSVKYHYYAMTAEGVEDKKPKEFLWSRIKNETSQKVT
jgi:type VI secretion system secreted protein Hcp